MGKGWWGWNHKKLWLCAHGRSSQAPVLTAGCSKAMLEQSLLGKTTSNRRAKGQFPVKSPDAALWQAQKLKDLPPFQLLNQNTQSPKAAAGLRLILRSVTWHAYLLTCLSLALCRVNSHLVGLLGLRWSVKCFGEKLQPQTINHLCRALKWFIIQTGKTQELDASLMCTMNSLRSSSRTQVNVLLGVISEPTLGWKPSFFSPGGYFSSSAFKSTNSAVTKPRDR